MSRPVGIDLGTYQISGIGARAGEPVVSTGEARRLLVVRVPSPARCGRRGRQAPDDHEPDRTIRSFKRQMGTTEGRHRRKAYNSQEIRPHRDDLQKLSATRELLGTPVTQAVITVPRYCDDGASARPPRRTARVAASTCCDSSTTPDRGHARVGYDKKE